MRATLAVLPGDGIGPEVVAEGIKVLGAVGDRYGHQFSLVYGEIGGISIDRHGTALADDVLAACRRSDAVLLGAVGGPRWDDPRAAVRPEQGLLKLRKSLQLFANLRPVKVFPQLIGASPLKPEALAGTDMIVVRELTGGLYFGKPSKRWETSRGARAVDTMAYSDREIERVVHMACELARGRRGLVTSVDKANVLTTSRLWREVSTRVGAQYPDVRLEHALVDSCAMQLVRNPGHFDVIVTENMFGDILTDEAAVLVGSLGMLPSASLGKGRFGLYEPIHGSAPDIAGQGKANPLGTILSVALLLRYSLGLADAACAVERGVERVLAEGYRTSDIAGEGTQAVSTTEMGDLVVARLT